VIPDLAAEVAALIGRPLRAVEAIAVAVSGGPDSLALLLLAHRAFGDRVHAVTVDHGLRPEAVDEAALVAEYAASLGVSHRTLRWDGPYPAANLQAAARTARYRLMGGYCTDLGIGWLATAHHQGDQAETLLLRLARGSGSGGLSGIRTRRPLLPGVDLLRPLLGASKADLAAVVVVADWHAVDDPSNRAPRFDRTRARATLAANPWLAPARLAASAAHLGEIEAALVWTADIAWRGRVAATGAGIVIDAAGLPRALARRLLLRAVVTLVPGSAPRGPSIDRLLDRLNAGKEATLAGVAARGRGGLWHIKVAVPRR
jgi:tRNA(Ile)-lysidine synthase